MNEIYRSELMISLPLRKWVESAPEDQRIELVRSIEAQMKKFIPPIQQMFAEGDMVGILGMYENVDKFIETGFKDMIARSSCKKGCSFCCSQNVDIDQHEAKIIAIYCQQKGIPIPKTYLQQQLQHAADKIAFAGSVAPCVFLKDNLCSIYPVRPLQCRKYYVFNDPADCNLEINRPGPHNRQVKIIMMNLVEILCAAYFNTVRKTGRLPKMMLRYAK